MWAPLHRRRACSRPHRALVPPVSGSYCFWSMIFVYMELGLIACFFFFVSVGWFHFQSSRDYQYCACLLVERLSEADGFATCPKDAQTLGSPALCVETTASPAPLDRGSFVSGPRVFHPGLCDLHFPSGAQLSR